MAGGVHQGDLPVFRLENCLLGENGDAPAAFQLMGVQKGVPVIHPSQPPPGAGLKQQRLGQRGLSRIHMGQQSSTTWRLFHFIWHTE